MNTLILVRRALLRVALALAILGALMIMFAPSAHAATSDPESPFLFALNVPQLLNLFIAVVFPLLVGVVTKKVTSGRIKSILLASISLASGLVSQALAAILAGVPFDVVGAFLTGVAAWLIAIATYEGFWKPTGVAAAVQLNVGVGASSRTDGAHNE